MLSCFRTIFFIYQPKYIFKLIYFKQLKMNQQLKMKITRKTSATSTNKGKEVQQLVDSSVKIQDLKNKIQQDRQLMRKSGKRFGKKTEENQVEINVLQQRETSTQNIKCDFSKKGTTVTQIQIQTEWEEKRDKVEQKAIIQVKKQTVNLNELSLEDDDESLKTSRIFDKEFSQQKINNEEITKFLQEIGLLEFREALLNLGYDQLQILAEITNEDLNFIMMRAPQQRKIQKALAEYKVSKGMRPSTTQSVLVDKPAFFKTKTKMFIDTKLNTKKHQNSGHHAQTARPKTSITESTTPTNNSFLGNSLLFNNNPAFFCKIGANEWSMQSMIRKGCSTCFKVFPLSDLKKQLQCFYCQGCLLAQNDLLGLNLNNSMVRDYL